MHQKIVDVLIVGAGPTGLTLACELRRRGIQIRLVDQMPARTTQSRALGLQARSLEIFEKLGVLDKILDKGLPVDTVQLYENGKQIGMTSLSILSIAYPFVLITPQADTEEILTHRLEELGGRIERSLTLVSLRGNQATLSNAAGEHRLGMTTPKTTADPSTLIAARCPLARDDESKSMRVGPLRMTTQESNAGPRLGRCGGLAQEDNSKTMPRRTHLVTDVS